VVDNLSSNNRDKLDQQLLTEAENDFKAGHIDDAVRKYHALSLIYRVELINNRRNSLWLQKKRVWVVV